MDEQQPLGSPPVEDQGTIQTAPVAHQEPQRAPAAAAPPTQGPSTGQENPGLNPPPVAIDTHSEAFQGGWMAPDITPDRWQDLGNRAAIAAQGSPIGQLNDYLGQYGAEKQDQALGVSKIAPEEAQKRFPGMPEPFTKPISPAVAQLQYDRYQAMKLRQQWAMHGGDHPIEDFAVGAAIGLADPVNVALTMATGGAFEALGAARYATTFARKALVVGGENLLAGGALTAASYEFEKSQHTPPDLASTLEWGAAQMAGMTALHLGWMKIFGKAEQLQKAMPKDLQEGALRTGVAQEEAGGKIDTSPQAAEAKARASGEMEGQKSPYRFQPLEHPSQRPFYTAVDAEQKPVQLGPTEHGFHAVDNPMAANHMAGEGGKVGEVEIPKDAKFIHADEPLPEDLHKIVESAIEKSGEEFSPEELEHLKEMPAGEILKALSETGEAGNIPPELSQSLKEAGYAGVRYTATDDLSRPVHNGVVLFDSPKPSRIWSADPELAKAVPDSQKEAFLDQTMGPENSKTATPEIEKELHDAKHEAPLNSTEDYLDPILDESYKNALAKLEARAETDPELKSDLDDLKKDNTLDGQEKQAAKDLANCIVGSTT